MGGKKGKEYEQRKSITDEQGVLIPSGSRTDLYSSISEIFVADLLSEGEIEGIVSGDYILKGDVNNTGYNSADFLPYAVQGKKEGTTETKLGFLKSVFWNEVPVVDSQGYYNYPEINIQEEKGSPVGKIPSLNSELANTSAGNQSQDDMQIALHRNIGDRLFGPPIEVGEKAPGYYKTNQGYISKGNASFWYSNYHSEYGQNILEENGLSRIYVGIAGVGTDERRSIIGNEISFSDANSNQTEQYSKTDGAPSLKGERIDRNAKTYAISNKECAKVLVNIRIPNLAEQIKDDTTDGISNNSKSFSSQRKGTSQSGSQQPYGQGDLRARKIRYQVFFRPVFDTRHSKSSFFQQAHHSNHEEVVQLLKDLKLLSEEGLVEEKLSQILNQNGFEISVNQALPNLDAVDENNQLENEPLKEFLVNIITESKESFAWKQAYEDEIFGRFDQPYIRSRTVNLESYGIDIWNGDSAKDYELFQGWEIKILRTTPDSVHTYLRNQSFVDSLVEIYKPKMRYPYCAMVYSKFGADNFTNAPARSYDARLIKVKIPNNYDPIKKTYGISAAFIKNEEGSYIPSPDAVKEDGQSSIPMGSMLCFDYKGKTYHKKYSGNIEDIEEDLEEDDKPDYVSTTDNAEKGTDPNQFWNGEFKSDKYWTDNPAWCFYDLMTNFRYGLGEYINVEAMDKWTLYDISKYCDVLVYDNKGSVEPRFTFNHLIISRDEAYKVLNDLASAFRSMLYYAFGQIYVVQDKPRDPVYHFNNANVIDGKFNYSSSARKARHTVALVRYIDKHSMYKPALSYAEDPEGIRRYGIREIETTAIGCTSEAQAKRFGDWMLKSETLETESITFSAGIEVSYLRPGDIFSVYDRYRNKSKFLGRALNIEEDQLLSNLTVSQKKLLSEKISQERSQAVTLTPIEEPEEEQSEEEKQTVSGEFVLPVPFTYEGVLYETNLLGDEVYTDLGIKNPNFNKLVVRKVIDQENLQGVKERIISDNESTGLTKTDGTTDGTKVKIKKVKSGEDLKGFEEWLNEFYDNIKDDGAFGKETTFYLPYNMSLDEKDSDILNGRKMIMRHLKQAIESVEEDSILSLNVSSTLYPHSDQNEKREFFANVKPYSFVFDEDNDVEKIVKPFDLAQAAGSEYEYFISADNESLFRFKLVNEVEIDGKQIKQINHDHSDDVDDEKKFKDSIFIQVNISVNNGDSIKKLDEVNVSELINKFNDISSPDPVKIEKTDVKKRYFEDDANYIGDGDNYIDGLFKRSLGNAKKELEYIEVEPEETIINSTEELSEEQKQELISNNIRRSHILLKTNLIKTEANTEDKIKTLIANGLKENLEQYLIFSTENNQDSEKKPLFYYKDYHQDFVFALEDIDNPEGLTIKLYGFLTEPVDLNFSSELTIQENADIITLDYPKNHIEGDCITLDRPINLTDNVKYNLSILTPSFNYENNEERIIDGLDSRDSKDIRKSFVQKLEFWGFQAIEETGNYYSEINDENGKGIVTKIIFNKDEESSRLNRLDFNVNPNGKHVWSIEPDFEGCEIDYSDTAVSGHLMNDHLDYYRIINIKEEENQYEINALQYSFLKYSDSDCHDAYLDSNSTYCEVNE